MRFCLAACPTYRELARKWLRPLGRIVLMSVLEVATSVGTTAQPHIDRFASAAWRVSRRAPRACRIAPSSSIPARSEVESDHIMKNCDTHPRQPFRIHRECALSIGLRIGKAFRALTPFARSAADVDLLTETLPPRQTCPEVTPGAGSRLGSRRPAHRCAQQCSTRIQHGDHRRLTRHGCRFVVPRAQSCCGRPRGIRRSAGAQYFARQISLACSRTVLDAILNNAAGLRFCDARTIILVLRGTPDEPRSGCLRKRFLDVSAIRSRLGLRAPFGGGAKRKVAYHTPAISRTRKNVRRMNRAHSVSPSPASMILASGPHLCCGSAGTYNLDHRIAASLVEQRRAR